MYVFRVRDMDERQIKICIIVHAVNRRVKYYKSAQSCRGRISSARRFNANLLFMSCRVQLLKARL